jgi:epoxyqueuosine reductase
MLIVPGHGSYLYLVEILTTLPFPSQHNQPMEEKCGKCRRCIDACPTGALEDAHILNASKCLSYLTIEHRKPTLRETGEKMGRCFFGCDICQEVCPFNPDPGEMDVSLPSTVTILRMDDKTFEETFGKKSFARAGLEKLKSNIRAIRKG